MGELGGRKPGWAMAMLMCGSATLPRNALVQRRQLLVVLATTAAALPIMLAGTLHALLADAAGLGMGETLAYALARGSRWRSPAWALLWRGGYA